MPSSGSSILLVDTKGIFQIDRSIHNQLQYPSFEILLKNNFFKIFILKSEDVVMLHVGYGPISEYLQGFTTVDVTENVKRVLIPFSIGK